MPKMTVYKVAFWTNLWEKCKSAVQIKTILEQILSAISCLNILQHLSITLKFDEENDKYTRGEKVTYQNIRAHDNFTISE